MSIAGNRQGGWNAPSPRVGSKKPGKSKRAGVGLAAVCAAAIVAVVGVVLWMNHAPDAEDVEPPKREKPMKPKMIKESVERRPMAPKPAPTREAPAKKPQRQVLGKTPTGEEFVAVEATTNTSGVVESLYTLADGSKKRVVMLQSKDTMVFDNDFDLMLGLIGTTPLDQKLPPMPDLGNMEDQFKKAMTSPIIVRESDTEQAKKMKEAAIALRLEISDLMREGYTLTQILSEYESLRDRNVHERHAFQAELNEIYRSGDIEGAREYLKSANEKLEQFGIIPLTMPGEDTRRR